jgi:hypothetical protein
MLPSKIGVFGTALPFNMHNHNNQVRHKGTDEDLPCAFEQQIAKGDVISSK